MKRTIFQFLILLCVGVFVFDSVEDTMSIHEETTSQSEAGDCHACACGQHFNTEAPAVEASPITFQSYLTFEPALTEYLPVDGFFHPPKHLA